MVAPQPLPDGIQVIDIRTESISNIANDSFSAKLKLIFFRAKCPSGYE